MTTDDFLSFFFFFAPNAGEESRQRKVVTLMTHLLHREDMGNREHSPPKPLLNSDTMRNL